MHGALDRDRDRCALGTCSSQSSYRCASFDRGPGADRTGDSTGGRAHFYRGDNTAEQIVAVPQIQEQNVEVIKVILQEQCQQMRFFFFESVWGWSCG